MSLGFKQNMDQQKRYAVYSRTDMFHVVSQPTRVLVCLETISYRANELSFVVIRFGIGPGTILLVERLTGKPR